MVRKFEFDLLIVLPHREVIDGPMRPRSGVGSAGSRREGSEQLDPTSRRRGADPSVVEGVYRGGPTRTNHEASSTPSHSSAAG